MDGEEIIQLYVRDNVASISRPNKELKAFKKILIKKGETKKIKFKIEKKDLEFYDSTLKRIFEAGVFTIYVGGNSVELLSKEIFIDFTDRS